MFGLVLAVSLGLPPIVERMPDEWRRDCETRWAVRVTYLHPNGWNGSYWTGHEIAPLYVMRTEAEARRLEVQRDGHVEWNLWCPDPRECSDIGIRPWFVSVKKLLCCDGGPQQACEYVDSLPPPAP